MYVLLSNAGTFLPRESLDANMKEIMDGITSGQNILNILERITDTRQDSGPLHSGPGQPFQFGGSNTLGF